MFKTNFLNVEFTQNQLTVPTFDDFFSRVGDVERIVEIGTGCGSLTMFLGLHCFYKDKQVITFDIQNKVSEKTKLLFSALNIDQRIKNVFENIEEVGNEIKKDGRTILLCDNGNKVKEFELLSKYLKIDDFIFAHDYSRTKEFFYSDMMHKYWNWFEIDEARIKDSCEKYNLEDFMHEEFQKCAWVCKRKIK